MRFDRRWFLKLSSLSLLAPAIRPGRLARAQESDAGSADVIVYGATPAGITSAIAAKREGASVLLIAPDEHLGGLMTSGLSRTDVSGRHHIGGLARQILNDIARRIPESRRARFSKPWDLEPHIAMGVFREWLEREGIMLWTHAPLKDVQSTGKRIERMAFEGGRTAAGGVFIDATYEGDLLASAGVSYTFGRESRAKYGEAHAGWHQEPEKDYPAEAYRAEGKMLGGDGPAYMHNNQFGARIPARDERGELLWGVHRDEPREPGAGDEGIQAYCFRLAVTDRPENRVPWPKPEHYRPERYELLLRYIRAHPGMSWHALLHLTPVTKDKFDMNASGPFTIDYVGGAWDYPNADHGTRRRIAQDHEDYQKGFLWFLANDERVPRKIRDEAAHWGLCKDEFTENNHWPPKLYVREARRMVGAYVMTEDDVRKRYSKPDVIGRGSFGLDSHPVQRFEAKDGAVEEEGHFGVWDFSWYEIPYRCITPKRGDCENLLAPVAVSASHVAFGSIRMEPTWMVLGHSAGVAAATASREAQGVQAIDVEGLQARLHTQDQRLWPEGRRSVLPRDLAGVVVDDGEAERVGEWTTSNSTEGFVGRGYLHDQNRGKGEKRVRFETMLPSAGRYEVRIAYPHFSNRAASVPVRIEHADGNAERRVDQQTPPSDGETFDPLGVFRFEPSKPAAVVVGNEGTDGYVIADAVQFVPVEE